MGNKAIAAALCAACLWLLPGCGRGDERAAGRILERARAESARGEAQRALWLIDSLRATYPRAVKARRAALGLRQEVELGIAQENVGRLDVELQRAIKGHDSLKDSVDGAAPSEDGFRRVNLARKTRDSLQAAFDAECAKVRYIRARMQELEPGG